MKQKQIQIQKQSTQQKIKQKTERLIKNIEIFKIVEKGFRKTTIKLVSELIDLHRIKNEEYSFTDLLQEKELENYSDIIETYVPYDVSPMVNTLYVQNKLSNTDMMVLKHTNKEFQTPDLQRKIVTKILTKEINSKELLNKTNNEIREMIGEKYVEEDNENYIYLHIFGNIANAKNNILKHKDYFNTKERKEVLKKRFDELKNAIHFGLKIKL